MAFNGSGLPVTVRVLKIGINSSFKIDPIPTRELCYIAIK
ncbi:IS1-like element transposase [Aeromonas sp. CU5]